MMQHNHQNIANMAIQIEGTNLARNEKTNASLNTKSILELESRNKPNQKYMHHE